MGEKDHKDMGEPREQDPDWAGPTSNNDRSCTDVIMLVLFIVFWIGMFVVASQGFARGNPQRLTYGTDSWGNSCGSRNKNTGAAPDNKNGNIDMRDKPVLFFGSYLNPDEIQICVEECPTETVWFTDGLLERATNKSFKPTDLGKIFCPPGFDMDKLDWDDVQFIDPSDNKLNGELYDPKQPCYYEYASEPIIRRCVPSPGGNGTAKVMDAVNAGEVSAALLADVNEAKYAILACCFIALVFAFIWLLLLRYCAGIMVWATIIVFIIVCLIVTIFFMAQANAAKMAYDDAGKYATTRQEYNYKTLYVFTIIAAVFTLVVIVVIFFLYSRIQMTIFIIEEAAEAMKSMPFIVFFPIGLFFVMGGFFAYWIAVWLYLATAGVPLFDGEGRVTDFAVDKTVRGLQAYHIFGGLWTVQFFLGFGEMALAGAIASWYYAVDKKNLEDWPVLESTKRVLKNHLGSVAFGALIIAIVQFIRLCLKYFKSTLDTWLGKDNCFRTLAEWLLWCLDCCFACLEKILAFISRNAYIHIAIYGDSFCHAAKEITQLLWRNALVLTTVNLIGDFMLFLGKCIITFIVGIIAIVWLSSNPNLNYYAFPVMIVFLLSYGIAATFMEVFEMAIDTIFVCVCEDLERYTKADSPPWASEELSRFMKDGKENQKKNMIAKENGKKSGSGSASGDGKSPEDTKA